MICNPVLVRDFVSEAEAWQGFNGFRDAVMEAQKAGINNWTDIQFYILHGKKPNGTTDNAEIAEYWWNRRAIAAQFMELTKLIERVANDQTDAAAEATLRAFLTESMARHLGLVSVDGASPVRQDDLDRIDWTGSAGSGSSLDFGPESGDCWASGSFQFTWYQMQDVILNFGTYLDNQELSVLIVTDPAYGFSITPPSWIDLLPAGNLGQKGRLYIMVSEENLLELGRITQEEYDEIVGERV